MDVTYDQNEEYLSSLFSISVSMLVTMSEILWPFCLLSVVFFHYFRICVYLNMAADENVICRKKT